MSNIESMNRQVDNLNKKKEDIRNKIEKNRELIARDQEEINKINDQIERITGSKAEDAAVTTASLGASSQADGGPSNWQGGDWQYRPKVGEIQKRKRKTQVESKKFYSFLENWS